MDMGWYKALIVGGIVFVLCFGATALINLLILIGGDPVPWWYWVALPTRVQRANDRGIINVILFFGVIISAILKELIFGDAPRIRRTIRPH